MLLLALGCSLPPASPADSAAPDEQGDTENIWDICWRSLDGDVNVTYLAGDEVRGGCEGRLSLWCDGGIRGAAELACDGSLESLTIALEGVQVGSQLGGLVSITGEDDPVVADWAAYVAEDFSVVGGFATSGGPVDGYYDLSGAFAVGVPASL
jgi:hypothetical protein